MTEKGTRIGAKKACEVHASGIEIRIESAIGGNFEGTIQGNTITGCVSNWVGRPSFTHFLWWVRRINGAALERVGLEES